MNLFGRWWVYIDCVYFALDERNEGIEWSIEKR